MQTSFEKIIAIVLAASIFLSGAMFFFQQKKIDHLQLLISGQSAGVASNKTISSSNGIIGQENQKFLVGKIKAISKESIEVETRLQRLKNPEKFRSGGGMKVDPNDFEITVKTVNLLVNEKTAFIKLSKGDLKVGDEIYAMTDSSPYQSDKLAALSIAYPGKGSATVPVE